MLLGNISGYDVTYDKVNDTLLCKDLVVPAEKLIQAYECGSDRCHVDGKLILKRFDSEISLGCLNLTINAAKQLIKTIKNARKRNG